MKRLLALIALLLLAAPVYAQEVFVADVPVNSRTGSTAFPDLDISIRVRSDCTSRFMVEYVSASGDTLTAYSLDAMWDDDADPETPAVCDNLATSLILFINTANFSTTSFKRRLIDWGKGDIPQHQPTQALPAGSVQ